VEAEFTIELIEEPIAAIRAASTNPFSPTCTKLPKTQGNASSGLSNPAPVNP